MTVSSSIYSSIVPSSISYLDAFAKSLCSKIWLDCCFLVLDGYVWGAVVASRSQNTTKAQHIQLFSVHKPILEAHTCKTVA